MIIVLSVLSVWQGMQLGTLNKQVIQAQSKSKTEDSEKSYKADNDTRSSKNDKDSQNINEKEETDSKTGEDPFKQSSKEFGYLSKFTRKTVQIIS